MLYQFERVDGKYDVSHPGGYDGRFTWWQLRNFVGQLLTGGYRVLDSDNKMEVTNAEKMTL